MLGFHVIVSNSTKNKLYRKLVRSWLIRRTVGASFKGKVAGIGMVTIDP